jgi:hypothetical protein
VVPAELLSPSQVNYLRETVGIWPLPPGIRGLGPMQVRTYRSKGGRYDVDISQLPAGEQYVEISRKVPVADAARAMGVLEADLSKAGVEMCADQSAPAVKIFDVASGQPAAPRLPARGQLVVGARAEVLQQASHRQNARRRTLRSVPKCAHRRASGDSRAERGNEEAGSIHFQLHVIRAPGAGRRKATRTCMADATMVRGTAHGAKGWKRPRRQTYTPSMENPPCCPHCVMSRASLAEWVHRDVRRESWGCAIDERATTPR